MQQRGAKTVIRRSPWQSCYWVPGKGTDERQDCQREQLFKRCCEFYLFLGKDHPGSSLRKNMLKDKAMKSLLN